MTKANGQLERRSLQLHFPQTQPQHRRISFRHSRASRLVRAFRYNQLDRPRTPFDNTAQQGAGAGQVVRCDAKDAGPNKIALGRVTRSERAIVTEEEMA